MIIYSEIKGSKFPSMERAVDAIGEVIAVLFIEIFSRTIGKIARPAASTEVQQRFGCLMLFGLAIVAGLAFDCLVLLGMR